MNSVKFYLPRFKSSTHCLVVAGSVFTLGLSVPEQLYSNETSEQPDLSGLRDAIVSESLARDLENLDPVYRGALEGGPTQTAADQGVTGFIGEDQLEQTGEFNIPTDSRPSPLFGAQPFTQQMLRLEEFGTQPLDPSLPVPSLPFPRPSTGPAPTQDPHSNAKSAPDPVLLEQFLAQDGIAPFPQEFSNVSAFNPWRADIEGFLGRALHTPPAEGRPPGQGWAHQRWNEFYPVEYFVSAQAGARPNGGFRDERQRHGYQTGEFAPGGLYHNTTGQAGFEGTTEGIEIRLHPNLPVMTHKSVWTFDGTFPPKLLKVRHGQPVLFRHYNALPIDVTANRGFGLHTITTHEHNGHTPAESDGYAGAFFFPGQYYDYRWPLALSGYDTVNTAASDPLAAFPCEPGETLFVNDDNPGVKTCENGTIKIRGNYRQTASTHWFHDHMIDFTAPNVYKGNAAMMNYYSAIDRGNEAVDDGVNLQIPSGSALAWGNRDYDVNLILADKAWDTEGQLWYNIFDRDGFLGDQMTVNWLYKPYLDVRARRYRLRILNGAVARYFKIALVHEISGQTTGEIHGNSSQNVSWNRVPFHLIANDGNIMEHAVPYDGMLDLDDDGDAQEHKGALHLQGIAERYDIIVDFSAHGINPGDKLYFVNLVEHKDGRGVEDVIDLGAVLRESYKAEIEIDNGVPGWVNGDPVVGKFLEFRVHAYEGIDRSMNPAEFEPGGRQMIPLHFDRNNPNHMNLLQDARRRSYKFGRSSGTDSAPWTIKSDGERAFAADLRRLTSAVQLETGSTPAGYSGNSTPEIWSLETGGGWSHPAHIHFEEGVILSEDGELPPQWHRWARKDVFRLGNEEDGARDLEIYYHFGEFAGSYVGHCHNTTHEDHAMLWRWDIEQPGQLQVMPAPIPTWDGVGYVDTIALPTFRSGEGVGYNPEDDNDEDDDDENDNDAQDSDGDGVEDDSDAFPNDATETRDSDGDGVGDNADAFPNDDSETRDSDGDGIGDNADAYPDDPNNGADSFAGDAPVIERPSNGESLPANAPIVVSFSAVTGAERYQVSRYDRTLRKWSYNNKSVSPNVCIDGTCLLEVPGVPAQLKSRVRVRAYGDGDWGTWSSIVRFNVSGEKPDTPATISPMSGSIVDANTPITIEFGEVAGAASYQLMRYDRTIRNWSYNDNQIMPNVCSDGSCRVEVPGVPAQPNSLWRVRVYVAGQWSDWSPSVRFKVLGAQLDAPIMVSPANGDEVAEYTPIALVFEEVTGADRYQVLRYDRTIKKWSFNSLVTPDLCNGGICTIQTPGLPEQDRSRWRVRAYGNAQWSAWSDIVSFDIDD